MPCHDLPRSRVHILTEEHPAFPVASMDVIGSLDAVGESSEDVFVSARIIIVSLGELREGDRGDIRVVQAKEPTADAKRPSVAMGIDFSIFCQDMCRCELLLKVPMLE